MIGFFQRKILNNPNDLDSVTMHYVQTNFEVIKGFYRLSVDDTNVLSANNYYSDNYEYNEVGDNSIKYSLTKYIGIQLPNDKFYSFLNKVTLHDNNEKIVDIFLFF